MMSRFLFITAWLLLWCQGFCSLQHDYFYDVKVSVHYSMVTFMMSRFLYFTVWLPLEETEQRPRSCQVSSQRHRTGTTWTYDRDSRRHVRRCLSESFPQVCWFMCYYRWPCRNHSHRFVGLCVIMGDPVGIIPTGLLVYVLSWVTLSESFPQVCWFMCYYRWPTHHYECTVSSTHLSHCSLADLYMYCRTHLYGIIACIEWILWSLELIMHSFYTCCTELWMYWTYFFVPMKFQYIRSRL